MRDGSGDGVDRRSFAIGALSTLGVVAGVATIGVATNGDEDSRRSTSSEVVSANASVYDDHAEMCAIDLVVDVAAPERVLITDDSPGGTDRMVEDSGERLLRVVAPSGSEVLVYAVDLEERTAQTLKSYRLTEDCSLSGGNHE